LAFPAPRSSLPVARRDLRGFPFNHRLPYVNLAVSPRKPGPHGLRSSLEREDVAILSVHRPQSTLADCLSWDSSELSLLRPFIDILIQRPFVEGVATFQRAAAASLACRPRRFSRPRRFVPLDDLQVCCALQPIMGFDAFWCRFVRWLASPRNLRIAAMIPCWSPNGHVPASTFIPPEGFSSPAAVGRLRSTLPPRTFLLRRSATFVMTPLPASPFGSYRRGIGPPRPCSAGQSVPSNAL